MPATGASLDSFKIDPTQVCVSGISGGAYMAQQFHIAYSSSVIGIGILAGGPFFRVKAESRRNAESADSNAASATTTGLPAIPGALATLVAILP